jgi:Mor family transcriptional regulator
MRDGSKPVNEKTERNEALYRDYLAGITQGELGVKYGINTTRVHYILKDMKRRKQMEEMREEMGQ